MSDILTKQDVRDVIKEEIPSIVKEIITEAIKANNETLVPMIMSSVKEEILAIYEEFGQVYNRFDVKRYSRY